MPALDLDRVLAWSAWVPLADRRLTGVPDGTGVYRVRRAGRDDLEYVGQTGAGRMTLRRRLGMLRGVYADAMPFADPHTAGPALWAVRRATGAEFLASAAVVRGPTAWRKGLEAAVVAAHRQAFGRSPAANFGRMPVGFRRSSGNTARLALAGRRQRGMACEVERPYHAPGVPPAGPLGGDPHAGDWGGHGWSAWVPLGSAGAPPAATGLYRIRDAGRPELLYVGEGVVAARLRVHRRAGVFLAAARPECAWVLNPGWRSHQRLELECDLIGGHVLATGTPPAAQFLGRRLTP